MFILMQIRYVLCYRLTCILLYNHDYDKLMLYER